MREVIWGGAAHFLFLLIDYTDFLHLLWQFFHSSSKSIATLLICISTVWWQSSLIYLHPFMDIIWLCLLQLGLCWWWFLLNYPLHPLLSRNFILFVAHCRWLPERLRDTGFILKETLNSVIIGLLLNLIYAARAYVISFKRCHLSWMRRQTIIFNFWSLGLLRVLKKVRPWLLAIQKLFEFKWSLGFKNLILIVEGGKYPSS